MERIDRVTVPPPDEAATRAAREAGLGVYLRGFRARHGDGAQELRGRGRRCLPVLLLAAAGLALPALATRWAGPWLGIPLLLVPFGALGWFLWRSFRPPAPPPLLPGEYVYLYERGLVCPGKAGEARAVPWRSVTAMHQDVTRTYVNGGYTGTHYAYRLLTDGRTGVTVGGFLNEEVVARPADSQIRELAQIVLDETVRRALQPAVTALEAGERVAFGEVALAGEGIALPSGTAPWERVRGCEWRGDGLVVVRTAGAGRWAREAKDIPDFPVFWTLVKELFPQAREFRR
ncbi:hypothetical protein KV205_09110 [Streptomyces sp. SKN60]|uniref:DUF6585 family protein n=1 Tax=Streptomyces sp. SKN60 TaxID=2855506 RepID=UPI0022453AD4|nr:DUF6585 family protein [Streptomyces sp. SKN60]MCX2180682.1 hypothetical protein [Streptomyces sp. SKN60]